MDVFGSILQRGVSGSLTLQLLDECHGHPGALCVKHHLALRHRQEEIVICTHTFL